MLAMGCSGNSMSLALSAPQSAANIRSSCGHHGAYLNDLGFGQDWLQHSCLHIVAYLTLDQVKTKLCQVFLLWPGLQHPERFVVQRHEGNT